MAALAPLNVTPARQPFGILDSSKLRSLQSIKNRQNAVSSAPSSLKRRHASPENSDSENVDPNILSTLAKRKRSGLGDDVSFSKPPRYSLTIAQPITAQSKHSLSFIPRLDTNVCNPTPTSAPAAAGRSPTRSKRQRAIPRTRFAPPSFGAGSPSLSIAAALSGTIAQKKSKKIRTIEESKPKSWYFDIYEEPEAQQDYTVNEWSMTQSANILDISDDEGKAKKDDEEDKENIPPIDLRAASVSASSTKALLSKKDEMTDIRTPLGDLNPADYFPDGLDATSVVLVHDNVAPEAEVSPLDGRAASGLPADFTSGAKSDVQLEPFTPVDVSSLLDVVAAHEPPSSTRDEDAATEPLSEAAPAPIEIWESQSAKDENEEEHDI